MCTTKLKHYDLCYSFCAFQCQTFTYTSASKTAEADTETKSYILIYAFMWSPVVVLDIRMDFIKQRS